MAEVAVALVVVALAYAALVAAPRAAEREEAFWAGYRARPHYA